MTPLLLGLCLVAGCADKPTRIAIKGPKGSLASTYNLDALPTFDNKDDSLKLRAIAYKEDVFLGPAEVRWKVEDTSVASVNQAGVLTILSSGKTKVRATALEGNLSTELDVVARILGTVKITEPKLEKANVPKLPMGEFLHFKAEVTNDRGQVLEDAKIRWESTTYAGTISMDGSLEGRAIGTTTIIASAANGASDSVEVEVTDWPKKKRRRRR